MIKYNVTGPDRKRLVKRLERLTGFKAEYQRLPTMAYKVGPYTVTKDGSVIGDLPQDHVMSLAKSGFVGKYTETISRKSTGTILSIPMDSMSMKALDNFQNILESKGSLIRKSLDLKELPVDYEEDELRIRWFEHTTLCDDDYEIISTFITALINKAQQTNHIDPTPVVTDNPQYTFRCFLNSLGFIGDRHKALRDTMLKRLPGSKSYPRGKPTIRFNTIRHLET